MSSNTQKRIISAFVILGIILAFLSLGRISSQILVFIIGALINDEIMTNFLKLERTHVDYKLSVILYILFMAMGFSLRQTDFPNLVVFLNVILDVFLIFFLFDTRKHPLMIMRSLRDQKYMSSLFIFLPIHSIARVMETEHWIVNILGLILLVATADISAWFIGKRFGKTKLWPAISPQKTQEGAIGGLVVTAIVMSFYWLFVKWNFSLIWPIVFAVLGFGTIIGDLVQSKFKRRFSLKDSSALIPGHGGIYDRCDSILFIAPFYLMIL